MVKFTKKDLLFAFANGIDFALINHNIKYIKTSKFREHGFGDFYAQFKSIKKQEKLLKNDEENKRIKTFFK